MFPCAPRAGSPAALWCLAASNTRDVPGAAELPDPAIDCKVLFSVSNGAKDRDAEVNPMPPTIAPSQHARQVGVPLSHRHLVVMFHQRS